MLDGGAVAEPDGGARSGGDLDAGRETEADIIALKSRDTERPESLPRQLRIEVLDLRAERQRQPVRNVEGHYRVDVEGKDLGFAGDAGLVEDRIAMVLGDEAERSVDADPDDDALMQPVGRVAGRDELVLSNVALVRNRRKPSGGTGSSFTSTSGKMPVPTTSISPRRTSARLAGFQNIEERLPPAAMPAKEEPCP